MNFLKKLIYDYRHLTIIGALTFLLIYLSSFNRAYGYFIDELYYIACANHPAFGYVDHPPLAPFILTLFQSLFGDSLTAIRFLPALAMALSAFMTGIITKDIGGGRLAQMLAAFAVMATPTVLAMGGFYSMNAFEPLLAITLLYYSLKMINENNPRRWITIGIVMGLGMMNKHTFALFIIALVGSFLLAEKWRLVLNKWFIYGGVCGVLIFLPNVVWQMMNGYPSLEFYKNISMYKNMYTPPGPFLMAQLITTSPSNFPIWLAGAAYLLVSKKMREFRFLSILFILLYFIMMATGTSRADRLMFAYPAVFAGGGVFFEYFISRYNWQWLKYYLIVTLFIGIGIALPVVLPYFSYETSRSWTNTLGMNTEIERGKKPPLPQLLADKIGWEEKVGMVNLTWQTLSDSDKQHALIGVGNYGQAGAMELFGKKYNFPPVVSAHNTYFLWSKDRLAGRTVVLQIEKPGSEKWLIHTFDSVQVTAPEYSSPYVSEHENHLKVFICRNPKLPAEEILERSKHYY